MNRRGSYAKGIAKREEILVTALDVIAREGLRRTSVRDLADAVGLSQAGLLHYFGSKEELYTAILRKRDELDGRSFAAPDEVRAPDAALTTFLGIIRHNADVPGLVQLFAHLSVDASNPQHPAHDFFLERQSSIRDLLTPAIAALQSEGRIVDTVPPDVLAGIVHALTDGLQTHWLINPDLDMGDTIGALLVALRPREAISS